MKIPLTALLLFASFLSPAIAQLSPPATQSAPASAAVPSTEEGVAALKAGKPQQALAIFGKVLQAHPQDVAANLYAASAALAVYNPGLAVTYAEKARALDPDNWKIHTTLVAAYAAAGRRAERDQEREILRKLHNDPHAPDAMQTNGFLLEMFPVRQYRVEAVEYFRPVGRLHVYYRFIIRNAAGKHVWQIDAESNDFDEKSWAGAHPDEAAASKRQFQLVGEDAEVHTDYRMFSGIADYDLIRAMIVQILSAQATPFPGEK